MTMPLSLATRLLTQAALWFAAFLSVFPFYWMIVGATNTANEITGGKATFGTHLVENTVKFFTAIDAPRIFGNSFLVSILGTVLTLVVTSLAGYGFEVFRSRTRDRIFGGLLLLLSIPFAALIVPLFMMFARAGLMNTYAGIMLPGIAAIFMIFYFRQNTKAFPHELRDAALLDGLKEWQVFVYIYIPVMRSTYAAAMIIVFMTSWNAYLWPLMVVHTNEMKTITLVVASLASAYTPDYGLIMIANVLATLPTILVFFLLQRRFVEGMLGSVK
ncbi:MAG: carbohydrate ABC transporter permease [Cypionkella sp.]